jgi:pseudouridine-5'-phosphate glycosidase
MASRPPCVRVSPEVAEALAWNRPVVALETTLIAHGLPRPDNLEVARELEAIVREEGGVPASVGVVRGEAVIGLEDADLERIASDPSVPKLSLRDLGPAIAHGGNGATTVASTAFLAGCVGVRLFATGGLGGVHRDARESWDESADLLALTRAQVAVVCAGVKSILDVGATLERLETLSIPVVGYQTDRFPSFYLSDSGFLLDWRVESPEEAARVIEAHLGLGTGALVLANPIPEAEQLDPEVHARVLAEGLEALKDVRGKAITPLLLEHLRGGTGGESLQVNKALVRNNVRLAAKIGKYL